MWKQFLACHCVASISSWVIAQKMEQEQKKWNIEGGGGGGKSKCLPTNPTILENNPWYFTFQFICKYWQLVNIGASNMNKWQNRLPDL